MKHVLSTFLVLFFSIQIYSQIKIDDEIIIGYNSNLSKINEVKLYISSSIKDTLSIIDVNSKQFVYHDVILEDLIINLSDTKKVMIKYHGNDEVISLIGKYIYIGTIFNKTLVISVTNEKTKNDCYTPSTSQ